MYSTRAAFNPQNESNRSPLHDFAIKTINSPLIDPYYAFMSSTYLIQTGFIDEGFVELKSLNKSDPKNLDVLNYLAGVTAQQGNYTESERYRLEMVKLDPWNAKNYLALGLIYKIQNDKPNMEKMLLKIESYAGSTPEADTARKELVL
jgi:tetratricopeptide (TPR) repeat protein